METQEKNKETKIEYSNILTEELIKKQIKINRFKLIADIILIVLGLLIGWYVFHNIESFKALSSDVCRLCEQKTGGTCQIFGRIANYT